MTEKHLSEEQQAMWDRLKYTGTETLMYIFAGDGFSTNFAGRFMPAHDVMCITVDGHVVQNFIDYIIQGTTISFSRPPALGAEIRIYTRESNGQG